MLFNTVTNSKNGIILNGASGNLIMNNTLDIINGYGSAAFNTGNSIEVISSNDSKVKYNRLRIIGQQPIVTVNSSNVDISDNDI